MNEDGGGSGGGGGGVGGAGGGDNEQSWLSGWEQECADTIDEEPDYEQKLRSEGEMAHTRIWNAFQDSATSIAQLYRERVTGEPSAIWLHFQTAAGSVTSLYKESSDSIRKSCDVAKESGYQKRNKEIMNWAKRKRRLICREDLLAYLSGRQKPPPPPLARNHHHLNSNHHHHHHHHYHLPHLLHNNHHHHLMHHSNMSHYRINTPVTPSPTPASVQSGQTPDELNTFREALSRVTAREHDLNTFISGEVARHGTAKRSASPSDVTMDSPTSITQKKPKFM